MKRKFCECRIYIIAEKIIKNIKKEEEETTDRERNKNIDRIKEKLFTF